MHCCMGNQLPDLEVKVLENQAVTRNKSLFRLKKPIETVARSPALANVNAPQHVTHLHKQSKIGGTNFGERTLAMPL